MNTANATRRKAAGLKSTRVERRLPQAEELQSGPVLPLVLLVGKEEYLLEQALARFWDHVVDPAMADFNRDMYYADEVNREELFAQAASFPMMADRRLVVLKRCEKAPPALQNDLLVYLDRPSPSTCLVICAEQLDNRRKVWTRLAKEAAVFEFPPLKPDALASWMVDACHELGRVLSSDMAARLAEIMGTAPLRMVRQEVEKLCLLTEQDASIGEAELATALGMEPDANVFHLTDAIQIRDLPTALRVLQSLMRQPEAAFMLMPLLAKNLGRLWFYKQLHQKRVSVSDMAERMSQKEYPIQQGLRLARSWQLDDLARAQALFLEADLAMKGDSPLSQQQIMFQLVARLCRIPSTN